MEYLDYYDEEDNYLGSKTREEVHKEGLWHHTIHCWLYDKLGNIYFQIRKDSGTFYTTASGHVLKGETIADAFKREIKEEIGIDIDSSDAELVDIVTWTKDKVKKDGTIWKDRAKAHVYVDLYEGNGQDFLFDTNEVLGIVKVNVEETLQLFMGKREKISAQIIKQKDNRGTILEEKEVFRDDFLVMSGESLIEKYGEVLQKVLECQKR